MKRFLLSGLWGILALHTPTSATTYNDLRDCVTTAIVERASAPDCPTIPRIRREIFDSLCRPQIDGYLQTKQAEAQAKGYGPEWVGFLKESVNDYITKLVDSSAPDVLKRASCN